MYDPAVFWGNSGTGIDQGLDHPIHKAHFDAILDMLQDKGIESVLEVGAGYGRITRFLLENLPEIKHYTAIEISYTRIQAAEGYIPFYRYPSLFLLRENFETFSPTQTYDLVISVECLMHQLPSKIEEWMRKMVALSKHYVMNLDWYETDFPPEAAAEWNFIHDYEGIYKKIGYSFLEKRQVAASNQWLYLAEVDHLSSVKPFSH